MPSLLTDGPRFFPNILRDQTFQRDGVRFGTDPAQSSSAKSREAQHLDGNIEWAVVDPRRHLLYVWDKVVHQQDDFPVAAKGLGATVVTNGSFNEYSGGGKYWSEIKVNVGCMWKALGLMVKSVTTPGSAATADKDFHDYSEKAKKDNFRARCPRGTSSALAKASARRRSAVRPSTTSAASRAARSPTTSSHRATLRGWPR